MCKVVVSGIQVIHYKANVVPAAGQPIRKRSFFRSKYKQCRITRGQYRLMPIIAYNRHPQHLAEKGLRVLTISHRYRQMVKSEIRPRFLPTFCGRLVQGYRLDMKRMCFEVRDALSNEHIRKDLVTLRRTDANTMPNQQTRWQC